jgi:hypothetical protein
MPTWGAPAQAPPLGGQHLQAAPAMPLLPAEGLPPLRRAPQAAACGAGGIRRAPPAEPRLKLGAPWGGQRLAPPLALPARPAITSPIHSPGVAARGPEAGRPARAWLTCALRRGPTGSTIHRAHRVGHTVRGRRRRHSPWGPSRRIPTVSRPAGRRANALCQAGIPCVSAAFSTSHGPRWSGGWPAARRHRGRGAAPPPGPHSPRPGGGHHDRGRASPKTLSRCWRGPPLAPPGSARALGPHARPDDGPQPPRRCGHPPWAPPNRPPSRSPSTRNARTRRGLLMDAQWILPRRGQGVPPPHPRRRLAPHPGGRQRPCGGALGGPAGPLERRSTRWRAGTPERRPRRGRDRRGLCSGRDAVAQ